MRRLCSFILLLIIVTGVVLFAGCLAKDDPLVRAHAIAEPYRFPFVSWECKALLDLGIKAWNRNESAVESELSVHIESVVREQGITVFPPPVVSLEPPPHLLIISPRDKIEYRDRLLLRQTMNVEDMESLERQIDALGFSSLVEPLGGFGGTFPPIVSSDATMRYIVNAAVEEWLHQYLAFKPLGFGYVLDSLGIRRDADLVTMNETAAGIISDEIGAEVYRKYYSNAATVQEKKKDTGGFDFDTVMSETRRQVDIYLAQGDIEKAEAYMEERRKLFVQNGYHIRKLNQAYFAFHGIYGQDPSSVSPVARDIERLRERTGSTKDFLDIVSVMTGYEDLKRKLNE